MVDIALSEVISLPTEAVTSADLLQVIKQLGSVEGSNSTVWAIEF